MEGLLDLKKKINFLTYQVCFLCFLSYFSILFVSQLRIKSRPIRQNDVHSSLRGFRFFSSIDWYFTESVKFLQSLQYISMQTLCTQKCTLVHCQTIVHTGCLLSNFHKINLEIYAIAHPLFQKSCGINKVA